MLTYSLQLLIIGSSIITSVVDTQALGEQCVVRRGNRNGVCSYIKHCPHVLTELGYGIPYTRCGSFNGQQIVCCLNPKTETSQQETTPPTSTTTTTTKPSSPKRIHEIKCLEYQSAIKQASIVSTLINAGTVTFQKCLHNKQPLIVGGQNATAGEFPHMALLGYNVTGQILWKCGGSLISEKFVLTAAHCLDNFDSGEVTTVRLGELDYSTEDDKVQPVDFRVLKRIPGPGYEEESKYNDIGLLELDRIVIFTPSLRPACLPSLNGGRNRYLATGWGVTSFSGSESTILKQVVLESFNFEQCKKTYDTGTRELISGVDLSSQFCAGSQKEKKDACQGDSGAPLQDYHNNLYCMYTLYGITSFGQACATPGVPAVYTNIFYYLDWIERTVWINDTIPNRVGRVEEDFDVRILD